MPPSLQSSKYLGPLPVELFICIIALSVSHVEPIDALISLEQLRLVSKTWHITIDSTPRFWATIPNHPKAAPRIEEWVRKSEETPLRIISKNPPYPLEPFISLLCLLAHQWKSIAINGFWDASAYLNRPAPLLEILTLFAASFSPDTSLFAGVTPSLTKVDLMHVKVPRNLSFLKSLKSLRLHSVTYTTQRLSIGQIYGVLTASPDLRLLSLVLTFEEDARHRTPITFPSLENLSIHSHHDQPRGASHLLSIIDPPNLIKMSTDLERGPALPLFLSWLARQSLHQTAYYDIFVERRSLVVSNSREEHGTNPYGRARFFGSGASFDGNGIQVLEEIDKLGIASSPLALTIKNPYCVEVLVDYLKQPKANEDGTHRWPLPTLSSVCFNHRMSKPILNIISNFARVRQDVARITIKPPDVEEAGEDWKKWDASSLSFVSFKDE